MLKMPQDTALDSTLALLFDPYQFVSKRCQLYDSNIFETRLLFQRTICMKGREATKLFYDPRYFMRSGATPLRIKKTLFGEGGIQSTDEEQHRHRKEMFMSFMTQEAIAKLAKIYMHWWQIYASSWSSKDQIKLYDVSQEILCRAVCEWVGVPLQEQEVKQRTRSLAALFDGAGAVGPRHWKSRLARWNTNKWIAHLIDQIRVSKKSLINENILSTIAGYRELNGGFLDSYTAAVELINILRPTIAISVFITFTALALHQYPHCKEKVRVENNYTELFIQEVRRFYPFFPSVMAMVRQDFIWNEYSFPQGRRVMLDLYGTNHDPKIWKDPENFRPERFLGEKNGCPFKFIPQGGGDYYQGHRCPGEFITIELLKVTLKFLANRMTYELPKQDLTINMSRLPALPKSGLIITNIEVNH